MVDDGEVYDAPPPRSLQTARDAAVQRAVQGQIQDERVGEPSVYACPGCGGILWQLGGGGLPHFACRTGHAWTADDLLGQLAEAMETALWTSVRLLDEQATLTRQVAQGLRRVGRDDLAQRVDAQAARDDTHARLIRTQFLQAEESPGAQVRAVMQALDAAPAEGRLPGDDG